MAKYWSTTHEHAFSWDQVASTYWKRYPNPNSKHVFSEDMLSAYVDENGILRTKRLIVKTNKLPSWGEHLFNTRRVWLIEETTVDPKSKTFRVYTRNLNLRTFMGTTERVTYSPSNPKNFCLAFKEVWIESDIYGLRSAIKSFGIDRFKKNCAKASEGFDWVLSRTFGLLHPTKPKIMAPKQQQQQPESVPVPTTTANFNNQ